MAVAVTAEEEAAAAAVAVEEAPATAREAALSVDGLVSMATMTK